VHQVAFSLHDYPPTQFVDMTSLNSKAYWMPLASFSR